MADNDSVYRNINGERKLSTERATCERCKAEGWRGDWPGEGGIVPDEYGNPVCDDCHDGNFTVYYSDVGNKREAKQASEKVKVVDFPASQFDGETPEALCSEGHCQCPDMENGEECDTAIAGNEWEEMTLGELADEQAKHPKRLYYVLDDGKEQIWWLATVEW